MGEHSPLPWGFYWGTDIDEVIAIVTADSKRYDICHFNSIRHPKNPAARAETKNANAKLIVSTVNLMPKVQDTIQWLLNLMNGIGKSGGQPELSEFAEAGEQAQALLAEMPKGE